MLRNAFFLLVLLSAAGPAHGSEPDLLSRLMREPVTLFDWGLAQLDRDIKRVARETFEERLKLGRPAAGARFDQERRQVFMGATLALPPASRSKATCLQAFEDFVAHLARVAPRGHSPIPWYLQSAFQPDGHDWEGSSQKLGDELLQFVRLHITLIPRPADTSQGDIRFVSCRGRLDAGPDQITVEETN